MSLIILLAGVSSSEWGYRGIAQLRVSNENAKSVVQYERSEWKESPDFGHICEERFRAPVNAPIGPSTTVSLNSTF